MWFGILGPLLVRDGESVVGVPAARQRVLLAALLLRGAGGPADALAELVWDGDRPPGRRRRCGRTLCGCAGCWALGPGRGW